jgi:hypothetical protein
MSIHHFQPILSNRVASGKTTYTRNDPNEALAQRRKGIQLRPARQQQPGRAWWQRQEGGFEAQASVSRCA